MLQCILSEGGNKWSIKHIFLVFGHSNQRFYDFNQLRTQQIWTDPHIRLVFVCLFGFLYQWQFVSPDRRSLFVSHPWSHATLPRCLWWRVRKSACDASPSVTRSLRRTGSAPMESWLETRREPSATRTVPLTSSRPPSRYRSSLILRNANVCKIYCESAGSVQHQHKWLWCINSAEY